MSESEEVYTEQKIQCESRRISCNVSIGIRTMQLLVDHNRFVANRKEAGLWMISMRS